MPLTDHPSLAPPLHDKSHTEIAGEASENLEKGHFQALSRPLPVSITTRNGLSLFLLLITIAWFWQPLVALYSLTQEQLRSEERRLGKSVDLVDARRRKTK